MIIKTKNDRFSLSRIKHFSITRRVDIAFPPLEVSPEYFRINIELRNEKKIQVDLDAIEIELVEMGPH